MINVVLNAYILKYKLCIYVIVCFGGLPKLFFSGSG